MQPLNKGQIRYLVSGKLNALEGITHAFPLRSGEPLEPLETLAKRMRESFGLSALIMTNQVHGTDVFLLEGESTSVQNHISSPYDAIVTGAHGLAVGVRTADCLPILIAAPGRAVAAIHAGWKGLLNGIIGNAAAIMIDTFGSEPQKMVAAVGPHILAACYEVGPDVAGPFAEKFGYGVLKPGKGDRSLLDLSRAATLALEESGIRPENIEVVRHCTHCSPERFHSFRRDGKPNGRQISFIRLD